MNFEQAFFDELTKIARQDRPGIIESTFREGTKGAVAGGAGGAAVGGLSTLNPVGAAAGGALGAGVGGALGGVYGAAKGVRNRFANALNL